jgi:hypothetical protein
VRDPEREAGLRLTASDLLKRIAARLAQRCGHRIARRRFPTLPCEFPASLETFPASARRIPCPLGAGNLPQPFDAAVPIPQESSP